jgi:hypothetical protein
MMEAPTNNEDKLAWCKHGDDLEKQFLTRMFDSGLSIFRNPAKASDPYTHDVYAVLQADIKSIGTPFRTADRYGFSPDYAITINEKDIKRYSEKYPNILIFLDINYPNYQGVRMVSLGTLKKFIKLDMAKKHEYINRRDDTQGNAKASYVFDLRWFDKVR